jgi:putative transposase
LGCHRYLITVVTRNRTPFFADADAAAWLAAQIPPFFVARDLEVVAYCIMPDHVHLLLEGTSEGADLKEAMRIWKQISAHGWKARSRSLLWQSGYHDHVLRAEEDSCGVVGYILHNPVRAGLARSPSEYRWLGSLRYAVADLEAHAGSWTPAWR